MYYARKTVVHSLKRLLGRRTFGRRYDQLLSEIDQLKPKYILEIGTNDGLNALRMVRAASKYRSDVVYLGFDLFEQQDRESFLREFALKTPSLREVTSFLNRNGVCDFRLFAGDTRETLPMAALPKVDLAFIDGGHSYETVLADWTNVQAVVHGSSVIYFDDYPNWGIGPVVDAIDRAQWNVEVLPIWDEFPAVDEFGKACDGTRRFQFVRVSRADSP